LVKQSWEDKDFEHMSPIAEEALQGLLHTVAMKTDQIDTMLEHELV